MRTRLLAALVAVSTLVLTSGCVAADDGDATVTVGLVESLSGDNSAYGEESHKGFEYIIDKINEEGGIESLGGAKIKTETSDTASDPTTAATETRRLIGLKGASLIVGTLLTKEMSAVAPVADETEVPVLSLFAGSTDSENLYTMGLPYGRGYAQTMVDYVDYLNKHEGANIKTAAMVGSDYEAGQQVDIELKKRLPKIGVKPVARVPLPTGGTDFKPQVTKLNGIKPDISLGLVTTQDGITLHQARAATGSQLLFAGGTAGFSDYSVWEALGEKTAQKVLTQNMFAMTSFSPDADQAHLGQFLKEAKAADLGVPIGQNFVIGAQAAWVVKDLLEKSGSEDPETILNSFGKVDIPAGSDHLYLPKADGIRFGKDRFLTDVTAIFTEWQDDGTQNVVWPEEFASAKVTKLKKD